jgi:predicted PurR-regulated permease PerM
MPDQSQPTDDRNPDEARSVLSTTLVFLSAAVIVGFLYFARDVGVPITLAILLSFLLSPAVRALRRWRIGRVTAVAVTVFVAFFIIFGFATVIVYEISSLARDLPENRYNLEAKVRSLPELVPGGAVFRRITGMLRDLRKELTRENHTAAPLEHLSPSSNVAEPAKPIPSKYGNPISNPSNLSRALSDLCFSHWRPAGS